ncbi:MAG TPA: cytochrome c oxidase subunit II, partial [Dehalococcoidia bacterium]|nr:cytochrome c oxidase subunit II [Dehalococcoidia bacterium]
TPASPLSPATPRASHLSLLWWIFFAMAAAIFIAVVAILLYGAVRRPSAEEAERQHPLGTPLVWIGGIAIPIAVLTAVYCLSIWDVAIYGADPPAQLTIDVIGHQWWWEVRYPQQGIVTANEIHIPINTDVKLELTSSDVIHDFWVPQLQGKIDAIPGESNTLTLDAPNAGTYRGQCLVYCGLQHANMNFLVVAEPAATFDQWLAGQQQTPAAPTDPTLLRGQEIFTEAACAYCHTVKGTSAEGRAAPDLTHFGSRTQIGAGVLPNNADALARWIANSQAVKPGNLMPPQDISGPDLQDLIAYLESLK